MFWNWVTTFSWWGTPSVGGDQPVWGRQAQLQGGATPPEKN